jgi:hypothetical protein
VLFSRVLSGLLAQVLVSYAGVPLVVLFDVAFATSVAAAALALAFPSGRGGGASADHRAPVRTLSPSSVLSYLRAAYWDTGLLPLSVWWMLAQCVLLKVEGYAASLWYQLDPLIEYNGYVDATARLMGAAGALVPALGPASRLLANVRGLRGLRGRDVSL